MTTTKRAYKLQEFVAHSLSVNCLKIGRKSSRVLVTGGEDHKVNLWAIGKPNAILSLSGHSSGIDSVSFDSSEVLVAAGAASGTIKLWDLEEAKIVRTLTGHRSNCISLDFHPFGEFFASGSLDTNLKIWDIRRKGCIHTYKGHSRGVNAIRFTPDGRWVVSGGEDNTVKLWDLTAGKLLHDFKCHEGQIQCIDFHPHEFLLATGSADRTVKFWDLETFELIGSAGPETSGVRCMTFNPDGRTLLCGLHESLKVCSWEPIRCHDTVDVGWSRLSDLNIHEEKLLGCSYNQSCVGVWVVDISRLEPYAMGNTARLNGHPDVKPNSGGNLSNLADDGTKASSGRLLISQNCDPVKETKSFGRLSVSQNLELQRDSRTLTTTASAPGTPQRINLSVGAKAPPINTTAFPNTTGLKRNSAKAQSAANSSIVNRSEVIPIIVPRNNDRMEQVSEPRKEGVATRAMQQSLQTKVSDSRRFPTFKEDLGKPNAVSQFDIEVPKVIEFSSTADKNNFPSVIAVAAATEKNVKDDKSLVSAKLETHSVPELFSGNQNENYETRGNVISRSAYPIEGQRRARTRSVVANWERRDRIPSHEGLASNNVVGIVPAQNMLSTNLRGHPSSAESVTVSATDEDTITDLLEQHDQFVGLMQSRLAKLQVVCQYWQRHDIRGALSAMEKMADTAVLADVISFLTEKNDIITLEICTCLLPLLVGMLESSLDRHQDISLNMLLKFVKVFGSVIYSSLSAPASVGVDIEAEQRMDRYNLCFVELEKVKHWLPTLTRRGGSIAKSAQELSLALQDVS
ncbi:katanin p80 WD40 repeat-containing subunit B1 homolog KTN80.4-like isoform X1 [Nicotiana tabacum]|uniref:Katanin p80 WD40 repeat-containing subunit B1 homolog n=2 Tax=Nicotiana TaxID=4085 RepID=A0A1S4A5N0_TOBAC|nr:PREDICTED: katanin p80 WD40 repeat-containing subunit B1 homolog isoform X1 [Nicotiana sylvestris]XP_016471920.1 PREDICTED: katanin p80 WD40 repeat-containing subunit B1 homolog isoform X1 [Nicotiana tabacum]